MTSPITILLDLIGFSRQSIDMREKIISGIGGFFGIYGTLLSSYWLLDPEVAVYIVPSMGASAVLLFAAPHSPFSQPWNVFVGHAFSAIIGVACWRSIPDYTMAASVSVGAAIAAMVFTRSIHPPGGATALAAVIGSERLHSLGYSYEYQPILLNTMTILLVAIVFNSVFHWRRYPAHLHVMVKGNRAVNVATETKGHAPIRHEDFVYALSHIDTYVDIDEDDLLDIYELATRRHLDDLEPGKKE
jgi:CBS domain-containing membrane protein